MKSYLIEKSPLSGVESWLFEEPDGTRTIGHRQPGFEIHGNYAEALRNCEEYSKEGKRRSFWHVGHISPAGMYYLYEKYGLKVWAMDRDGFKKLKKIIDQDPDYRKFKTVTGRFT